MQKKMVLKALCVGVVAGMLLIGLQPVQAVEVKLSGQINRAIMWADDGNNDDVLHVDNDNSSTRFRLTGSEQVSDSVKVGVVWESQFESNSSSNVQINQNDDGSDTFSERKLEAYFIVPLGKISIGQGDGAGGDYTAKDTDMSELREIRVNLVVRTRGEDSDFDGQPQLRENRTAAGTDGFRRRVYTSTVRVRNMVRDS